MFPCHHKLSAAHGSFGSQGGLAYSCISWVKEIAGGVSFEKRLPERVHDGNRNIGVVNVLDNQ